MPDPILILTYIAVIFLIGILISIISKKFRVSNILLLLITGMILNNLQYKGAPLISFPNIFLTSISILALAMIVFDAASRFKFKEFDKLSFSALKLTFIFLFLNLIFLTISTMQIFNIKSVPIAILFAALMSGTAPDVMMAMFQTSKNRVIRLLEVESIINTPLIMLIPFIILDFIETRPPLGTSFFIEQLAPFLQQMVVGIGAGILVGIIVFKFMRNRYSEKISPLAILTAAILTYVLAENLQGNGVLAVTVLGLFFGSIYVKGKDHLHEFSAIFANALEILVFILVGLMISFPLSSQFIIKSLSLFFLLILIRFFAIQLSFHSYAYSFKEKIFMSLNVQKGIAVAVIAFTLSTLFLNQTELINLADLQIILQLILSFILYSIILSTIVTRISKIFIGEEVKG